MSWARQLEADLDWREGELASLKHQVVTAKSGSVAERSLLRAFWAMLYAHFEGFWRFALIVYLKELENSGIARAKCLEPLAIFSLRKDFREFRGQWSDQRCLEFFAQTLHGLLNAGVEFDVDEDDEYVLKGKSNMYPDHLQENCDSAGLQTTLIQTHRTRLNVLVRRRNDIAHGQRATVKDLNEYQEYEDAAFLVMQELAIAIFEALENKTYLKPETEYHI
jgi:hypothetical protein